MIKPQELASLPRDTKREQAIARELRSLEESKRWNYIKSALDADTISVQPIALVLANKVALNRNHLMNILEISIERANPSSMNSYLKAVVAGLGHKRVINFFRGKIHTNPEKVGMALYFLPNLSPLPNKAQLKLIYDLRLQFEKYVKSLDIKTPYLNACIKQ